MYRLQLYCLSSESAQRASKKFVDAREVLSQHPVSIAIVVDTGECL